MSRVQIVRGDARALPLTDNTVDLVVTSPPYFALRSYTDQGEHYGGQIGSENTPAEWLAALLEVTRECVRVLKPSGSLFVNLGDKYSGNERGAQLAEQQRWIPKVWQQDGSRVPYRSGLRAKSLMGLPWRYALACIDDLGLILRAEIIWAKPNGLPESVQDRVRRSHETWFHLVQQPRYYSAVDEIREPQDFPNHGQIGKVVRSSYDRAPKDSGAERRGYSDERQLNPLGKLPGSVWTVPSEPLTVPAGLGVDHFAAFPLEWPRRIIRGWCPAAVCTACGEGRRPVVDKQLVGVWHDKPLVNTRYAETHAEHQHNRMGQEKAFGSTEATITGYVCACTPHTDHPVERPGRTYHDHSNDGVAGNKTAAHGSNVTVREAVRVYDFDGWAPPPTTPGVVLDPFGGTGTTALAAHALGRDAIHVDLSADYNRIAQWRTTDRDQLAKAMQVTRGDRARDNDLYDVDPLFEVTG